jgi:hypothetical protein
MGTVSAAFSIAAADIALARIFGIGGQTWTILLPTGDGITAERTFAGVATWTGSIVEERVLVESTTSAGNVVGSSKQWVAVGLQALPVPGARLQSTSSPRFVFEVGPSEIVSGYARATVRPIATSA